QLAVQALRRHGEPRHLAGAVALLDEPRLGAAGTVKALLEGIEQDRIEATARALLHDAAASPAQLAWAIDQVGVAVPAAEEAEALERLRRASDALPVPVHEALGRLASRVASAPGVRPQQDEAPPLRALTRPGSPPNAFARAAALTPERAAELVAHPEQET